MSQGNQSCLRFSLEESIWFQKGQEVAELVSISLDPIITIQENDQYVTIRGSLELTGEYKRYEDFSTEEEEPFSAPKFIHSVEERDGGICEFLHRFPVDITIPNNRIQSVYDVDVAVDSFDYLFPERTCMKLTADLTISGLYGEQQNAPVEDEEAEEELELLYRSVPPIQVEEQPVAELEAAPDEGDIDPTDPELLTREAGAETGQSIDEDQEAFENHDEDIYEPFQAEARKQPELESPVSKEEVVQKQQIEEIISEPPPSIPEISFSAIRNEETTPSAKEIYQAEEVPLEEEKEETQATAVTAETTFPETAVLQEAEESENESSPEQPKLKKKKPSKNQSLSLTEFFARKEEEEVAKLKVCIVQQGDTLDILAERYDLSVQQLLRVNHLEANQDVYEGQVLYIPVAVAQKP